MSFLSGRTTPISKRRGSKMVLLKKDIEDRIYDVVMATEIVGLWCVYPERKIVRQRQNKRSAVVGNQTEQWQPRICWSHSQPAVNAAVLLSCAQCYRGALPKVRARHCSIHCLEVYVCHFCCCHTGTVIFSTVLYFLLFQNL